MYLDSQVVIKETQTPSPKKINSVLHTYSVFCHTSTSMERQQDKDELFWCRLQP